MSINDLQNQLQSVLTGSTFSLSASAFNVPAIDEIFSWISPDQTLRLNSVTLSSTGGNIVVSGVTQGTVLGQSGINCTATFGLDQQDNPTVSFAFSGFLPSWFFSMAFPLLKNSVLDQINFQQILFTMDSEPPAVLQENFQTQWAESPDPQLVNAKSVQGITFSGVLSVQDLSDDIQWLFGAQPTLTIQGMLTLYVLGSQSGQVLPKLWLQSQEACTFDLLGKDFPLTLEFVSIFSQADSKGNYTPDCYAMVSSAYTFSISGQTCSIPFDILFSDNSLITVKSALAGQQPLTISDIENLVGVTSLESSIPSSIPSLSNFVLDDFSFTLNPNQKQIISVSVTVGTAPSWNWPIMNKFSMHSAEVLFVVNYAGGKNGSLSLGLSCEVDVENTTLDAAIYLPSFDFYISQKTGTTFDIKPWVEEVLGAQLSTNELSCTAFSLSGNVTSNQYSFFAQVSSNLGFAFENTQVTLQQVQVQLSAGSDNSVMLYGQFLVGKVPINVGFSYASGAWQLQGGTTQTSQIPLGQFITYFAQKFGFGASLPQAVQDLTIDSFYFSYDSSAHDFSGQFSLSESQPVTIGGHALKITLQVKFSRQASTTGTAAQLTFQFTGQLQVAGQQFDVNLQEDSNGFSFQAAWQSQDGKGIGFEDLAQALGITQSVSVPSNVDLSLTAVAISYTDQADQFVVSAATPQGNAFFVTQKDASGNTGFIFGVDLSNITTASSIPGYGSQFQVVDSLDLEQFGLILSTAAFPAFSAPAFPPLPGTTTPLVIDMPSGPVTEGASLTAKLDFTKTTSAALQKTGTLIGQETLTLSITYNETSNSVVCSANLSGNLNLATSKGSNFAISDVLFYLQFSDDNVSVNLQGGASITLFNTPYNVTSRITVSDTEAEITFDLEENQSLPSPPQLSTMQLAELGLGAGIEFEPPSLDFSLEGKIVIGQDQDDFALVLEIEEVALNPALLTFNISDWTLGDAVNHFSSQNGAGIDFVTIENLFFYWCETPQVLPDGTVAQPGFAFSCGLKLWDFSGYGCFQIDAATGVSGMVELAPIQWGSFFSLTGNGQGIANPVPSIAASFLPSLYGSSPQAPASTATTSAPASYFVAPGGPVMQFSGSGNPYFSISLKLSILDLEELEAEGTLDQNGFSFDILVKELIFSSQLSCSYSSASGFSATASVIIGIQNQQIDVLGVSFSLTCDVQGSLAIACTSSDFSLTITGSFDFEGHTFSHPTLTLDASFGGFSNLASHVMSAIVNDAESIFGGAIDDLKKIGTAIATGVEDAGQAVATGAEDAASAVATGAEAVASTAANVAQSAETAVSSAASDAWSDIKSWW